MIDLKLWLGCIGNVQCTREPSFNDCFVSLSITLVDVAKWTNERTTIFRASRLNDSLFIAKMALAQSVRGSIVPAFVITAEEKKNNRTEMRLHTTIHYITQFTSLHFIHSFIQDSNRLDSTRLTHTVIRTVTLCH